MSNSISSKQFYVHVADFDNSRGASSRAARRIIINADIMKNTRTSAGDVIAIAACDQELIHKFAVGIAWPSLDIDADTVYVSASHLRTANLQKNNRIRIYNLAVGKISHGLPSLKDARAAATIHICEDDRSTFQPHDRRQHHDWLTLLVREILVDIKYILLGQHLNIKFENTRRQFTVTRILSENESTEDIKNLTDHIESLSIDSSAVLWIANWDTVVKIQETRINEKAASELNENFTNNAFHRDDTYSSVGGLDKQITQIRDLIEIPLLRPDLFRHFDLKPPKGILLYGPPGTGKTHLARAIVAATRSSVIVVNGSELSSVYHGETEAKLRDVFDEAKRKSPCIVVLDEVDALCPRREDGGGGEVEKRVVATLLTILDGMDFASSNGSDDARVVVIATTNRPNAIDPALRRPGRFDREIEIGIPDAVARHSILKVLLARSPHEISDHDLRSIASRTHGYVGADLAAVVREAGTVAIKRSLNNIGTSAPLMSSLLTENEKSSMRLTLQDLEIGLSSVQPSAMREVFIETPQVRWSDIGGQEYVKQRLKECIEWPLIHPETFERLGIKPPKGVLLYGPPGCSKTLTAKALATESGINFIAVKGPELINKFVGESERAVREIFRKARAASPSIVFFDEIDALGTSRSVSGNSHEGVLTTLLNEMDGVQELVGVTVVAATNRPDVIDSALMRPGRLDRILYVGPPDYTGRIEILKIQTSKMTVDPDINLEELAHITDGCSGAEIAALCRDAALLCMKESMDAPFVSHSAFLSAAKTIRRQITPEMILKFEHWRDKSGLNSA